VRRLDIIGHQDQRLTGPRGTTHRQSRNMTAPSCHRVQNIRLTLCPPRKRAAHRCAPPPQFTESKQVVYGPNRKSLASTFALLTPSSVIVSVPMVITVFPPNPVMFTIVLKVASVTPRELFSCNLS